MTAGRSAGAAAMSVLLLVAGCRQPDRLDMERATRQIRTSLVRTYGRSITKLDCPSKVEARRGDSFRCSLQVDGHPLSIVVTQATDDGDLRVRATAAVLDMAKVRADLKRTLAKQLGRKGLSAGCGAAKLRIVPPGGSFDCRVRDAKGSKLVTVKVRDVNGTVTYEIH